MSLATLTSEYLSWIVQANKWGISNFWRAIILSSIEALLAFLILSRFYPSTLSRFGLKFRLKPLLVGVGLICFLVAPSLLRSNIHVTPFRQVGEGVIFALFIGIREEFFSRGLIFGLLENYGVMTTAVISSLHFGVLHFGNIIWGGQSFSYTLGQVLSAGSFGLLCAGLMIYTGSIWVPILLHGLIDTPMQFDTPQKFISQVTGGTNWPSTISLMIVYCATGVSLLYASKLVKPSRLEPHLRSLLRKSKFISIDS